MAHRDIPSWLRSCHRQRILPNLRPPTRSSTATASRASKPCVGAKQLNECNKASGASLLEKLPRSLPHISGPAVRSLTTTADQDPQLHGTSANTAQRTTPGEGVPHQCTKGRRALPLLRTSNRDRCTFESISSTLRSRIMASKSCPLTAPATPIRHPAQLGDNFFACASPKIQRRMSHQRSQPQSQARRAKHRSTLSKVKCSVARAYIRIEHGGSGHVMQA